MKDGSWPCMYGTYGKTQKLMSQHEVGPVTGGGHWGTQLFSVSVSVCIWTVKPDGVCC